MISEVTKSLGIPSDRLCILVALLGNFILTERELVDFYKKLNITVGPNNPNIEQSIRAIAKFVKELPSVELDAVAQKVFGSLSDPRCSKLRQSIQYYINGTKEGFLHYKPAKLTKRKYISTSNRECGFKGSPLITWGSRVWGGVIKISRLIMWGREQ